MGINIYDLSVENNVVAEKFNEQLYLIFKLIDDKANDNAIEYEIKKLENIYKNIEVNEGLNGIFKHYARNLTAIIRNYKSEVNTTLSDLTSEQLIYISSRIDEMIKTS